MRVRRNELILSLVIIGVPALAWLASEVRWARINLPTGKFATAGEYLAAGRLPSRVTSFATEGAAFLIAYSPVDTWPAVPSGAAAYVFDEAGRMVAWTGDAGDDTQFQYDWPLKKQRPASIEDLQRIAFQQSDGG